MSIPVIDTLHSLGDFPVTTSDEIQCGDIRLNTALSNSASEIALKANKTYVDSELSKKATPADITTAVSGKADKTYVDSNFATKSEIPTNYGTYSKPSTGIPKTDLASDVQTSLGKADTALQSHQSLANYVTTSDSRLSDSRPASDVSQWAKASTKPTYSKSEIGLGNVDNTSDLNKPISTATQAAIDEISESIYYVTPQMYGATADGSTDDTEAIIEAITTNYGKTIFFPAGTYVVTSSIEINGSCRIIFDSNAVISVNSETVLDTLFTISTDGDPDSGTYTGVYTAKRYIWSGGTFKCNSKVKKGFVNNSSYMSRFDDLKVIGFTEIGFENTHEYVNGNCTLYNCLFWGKNGNAEVGYKDSGYDHYLYSCSVVNCNTGYILSNDKAFGCTVWIDENGTYDGTVGYASTTRATITSCTADTVQTALATYGNYARFDVNTFDWIHNSSVCSVQNAYFIKMKTASDKFFVSNATVIFEDEYNFANYSSYIDNGYFTGLRIANGIDAPSSWREMGSGEFGGGKISYKKSNEIFFLKLELKNTNGVNFAAYQSRGLSSTNELKRIQNSHNLVCVYAYDETSRTYSIPRVLDVYVNNNGQVVLTNDSNESFKCYEIYAVLAFPVML